MKHLKNPFRIVTLLLVLAVSIQINGQNPLGSELETLLDSVVRTDMKEAKAPGAMIRVTRNGTALVDKPYGIRSAKTKEPVTTSTLFLTASVTKVITTTTLLTLCHERGIPTDTQVGSILKDLSPQIGALSVHQILSQSSGILDHKPTRKKWKNSATEYFRHYGDKIFCKELEGVFSYTNYGHVLAGLLVEELSGRPFDETVQNQIFDPLNMTHSTYSVIGEKWANHASAHRSGKAVSHGYTFPMIKSSASLFSTAGDLTNFAVCFMNHGKFEGRQVIPETVIQQMTGKYTPVGVLHNYFGYPGSHYGYGLMTFNYQGNAFTGHPGETTTQNLLFAMSPSSQTSFVLMSNAGTYPFIKTFEFLANAFMNGNQNREIHMINENGSSVLKKKPPSGDELKEYTGMYYTPVITGDRSPDMEVFKSGDQLRLQLTPEESYELTWIKGDLFKYKSPQLKFPIEVLFYRDKTGNIRYLNHYWRTSVKTKP